MIEQNRTVELPRRILLATDLSARCDRALDRAAALAQAWNAELIAVHALEQADFYRLEVERRLPSWRQAPDPALFVTALLRRDMMQSGLQVTALAEEDDPTELILRTASSRACGLIVTGIARDETLGRFGLGATVNQLLPRAQVPLLVVKGRVRGPYGNILVATDFSDCSMSALQAAVTFFPEAKITVLHAYDAPLAGMTGDPAQVRDGFRDAAAGDCAAFFVRSEIAPEIRRKLGIVIEHGRPSHLIHQFVRDCHIDLVVLGTHGRSGFLRNVLGSTSSEVVGALPCDTLVVAKPPAQGCATRPTGSGAGTADIYG